VVRFKNLKGREGERERERERERKVEGYWEGEVFV
jgi:hypothetical protein